MNTSRRSKASQQPASTPIHPGMQADNYAVPALEKGLDVLELLVREPVGLSKTQIARELNRTVSEIFRMLVCLERRGYIAQVSGDRFALTLKMFKLVQEHPPTERLIATALPIMHRLAHKTLQSCHMGVLEGGRLVILAQVNAPTAIGFYVKPGSTVDILEAASGYVLLAHKPKEERERVLQERSLETGNQPPRDLHVHLARICKAGFEKRASYLVKGVLNISFPIFGERHSAVAALTVPFIQQNGSTIKDTDVIAALRQSALEISSAIGGGSPIAS
ncbi:MAG: IclR family transcriptional regulator [Janthinobacterium lividum]